MFVRSLIIGSLILMGSTAWAHPPGPPPGPPPKEAVDLVKGDDTLPEDQPAKPQSQPAKDPAKSKDPVKDPAKPTVPSAPVDEPGRVVL